MVGIFAVFWGPWFLYFAGSPDVANRRSEGDRSDLLPRRAEHSPGVPGGGGPKHAIDELSSCFVVPGLPLT